MSKKDGIEIDYLRKRNEALKNYYEILISKNMAKIERAMDGMRGYVSELKRKKELHYEGKPEVVAMFKKCRNKKLQEAFSETSHDMEYTLNKSIELLERFTDELKQTT